MAKVDPINAAAFQLIANHAEQSAANAVYSAKSAASGASLPSGQLAEQIAAHKISMSEHDQIASSLAGALAGHNTKDAVALAHAAISGQNAAAAAHGAAVSVHQAKETLNSGAIPSMARIVDHFVHAQKHQVDAGKLSQIAMLLNVGTAKAPAAHQITLSSAARANEHAATANDLAAELHKKAVTKPHTPPPHTPPPHTPPPHTPPPHTPPPHTPPPHTPPPHTPPPQTPPPHTPPPHTPPPHTPPPQTPPGQRWPTQEQIAIRALKLSKAFPWRSENQNWSDAELELAKEIALQVPTEP